MNLKNLPKIDELFLAINELFLTFNQIKKNRDFNKINFQKKKLFFPILKKSQQFPKVCPNIILKKLN